MRLGRLGCPRDDAADTDENVEGHVLSISDEDDTEGRADKRC